MGTALDIWEVIEAYQAFNTLERLLDESELTERQVSLALAYYAVFPIEIDRAIAANRQDQQLLRQQYPMLVPRP